VINFDAKTDTTPDMTSPSALCLQFVLKNYVDGTDNVVSPEDLDTFDPDFITWNLNISEVFTTKMELIDPKLTYGNNCGFLQEPIIIIKYYDPLTSLDHSATRIVRPGVVRSARKRCLNIFFGGIIPALKTHGIKPDDFPVCFKRWHKCIYVLLEK